MPRCYLLLALLPAVLAACSTANERRCRTWQDQGIVVGSLDSCSRCVDQLGNTNVDAVRGCSLGLDAAALINQGR